MAKVATAEVVPNAKADVLPRSGTDNISQHSTLSVTRSIVYMLAY